MIYKNKDGFPTDGFSHDMMDSAVRISILNYMSHQPLLGLYELNNGLLVRGPEQPPADNPLNCSRDQTIMLVSAFNRNGDVSTCRRILFSHIKRFFFAQNIERDKPGSTKHPYPHTFINDKGEAEKRSFDYADPLLPHHIGQIVLAAKFYPLYLFMPLAYLFLFLELLFQSKAIDKEQNQLIALCHTYGWLRIYKLLTPNWYEQNYHYWNVRDEIEYGMILECLVENKPIIDLN